MKKTILSTLGAAALLCFCQGKAQAQMLLINEVYAGGGSGTAGTSYTRDYVELYNPSATAFSLAGYAIQYAPGTSATFSGTVISFGAGSVIGANDYLSIYTGSAGTAGTALTAGNGAGFVTYVNPGSGGASLSNTSGSVRLYNTATSTAIDILGYGTLTNATATDPKVEGTAAASPSSTASSLGRTNFVDTNNNSADFTNMTPSPNGGTNSIVVVAAGVPEPSTYAAMSFSILCMFAMLRARRRTT